MTGTVVGTVANVTRSVVRAVAEVGHTIVRTVTKVARGVICSVTSTGNTRVGADTLGVEAGALGVTWPTASSAA